AKRPNSAWWTSMSRPFRVATGSRVRTGSPPRPPASRSGAILPTLERGEMETPDLAPPAPSSLARALRRTRRLRVPPEGLETRELGSTRGGAHALPATVAAIRTEPAIRFQLGPACCSARPPAHAFLTRGVPAAAARADKAGRVAAVVEAASRCTSGT